jgi:hypothetical protein
MQYYSVLCSTIQYYAVLFSIMQYYSVLLYTVYSSSLRRIEIPNHEEVPLLDSFQTLGIHCCTG